MAQQINVDALSTRPTVLLTPDGYIEPRRYDVARGVHSGPFELHYQELSAPTPSPRARFSSPTATNKESA
jgi:hypothetical protein